MKTTLEFSVENASPELMSLFITPVVSAFWILMVGLATSFILSVWRAHSIRCVAKKVYSTHPRVLKELQDSLDSLILWEKGHDDGKETLTIPEIDFGGLLAGSIDLIPKWFPFPTYRSETYYLLQNLNEYKTLKQPSRILTEEVSYSHKIKTFATALNLACNTYIKILYLSDKSQYKKDNISIESVRNIDFPLSYYGCDSKVTGKFFKLLKERQLLITPTETLLSKDP